ncbi:flagellar brake protein [Pontibacterium granulatum]|uniref:flagellar brake protein n=1 Tax=Pontibacterium granulatum TaxID=2036029 RepID=UPI00249C1417|nr:flagellar brake protein [Pontibacterium granulatum]MDI3325451.1 flagellar brake protein [Pontibacterium granulatum]
MQKLNITPVEQLPNFRAGTRIQISSQDGKLRFITSLVGIDGTNVIVAHLPTTEELEVGHCKIQMPLQWYEAFFRVKENLVIRLVDRGVVYAFETSVMEVAGHKNRLLMLNYPERIFLQDLRREPRYPCTLLSRVYCRKQLFEGVIKDISQSGCQIRVPQSDQLEAFKSLQQSGLCMAFEIRFPNENSYYLFKGDLISVLAQPYGVRLGIAFKSSYPEVKEYLGSLSLD